MSIITEKYRPKRLDDIVSQDHVVRTLRSYLEAGGLCHLLLQGNSGVGKTSCIHALAREMYGDHNMSSMMLELNGSDDRGINVIRTQIKNFSRLKNITCPGKPKLIVLDEADSMTFDAQSALRRVMEKNTGNVRFCLICNYIHKLIPALQSRCTIFRFRAIEYSETQRVLKDICEKEDICVGDDVLREMVSLNNGDLRRCLNFLDSHRSLDSIERCDLIRYRFSMDTEGLGKIETIIMGGEEKENIQSVLESLETVKDQYRLSLENVFEVISYHGLRFKRYDLLAKLAELEYLYYKSRHMFESVFIRGVAGVILESKAPRHQWENS
jgi:replication factor C subunit 3/5